MKKSLFIALFLSLALTFAACSEKPSTPSSINAETSSSTAAPSNSNNQSDSSANSESEVLEPDFTQVTAVCDIGTQQPFFWIDNNGKMKGYHVVEYTNNSTETVRVSGCKLAMKNNKGKTAFIFTTQSPYQQILKPGESSHILFSSVAAYAKMPKKDELKCNHEFTAEPTTEEQHRYPTNNLKASLVDGVITITGEFENDTDSGDNFLQADILIKDKNGIVIGNAVKMAVNLDPGEKEAFSTTLIEGFYPISIDDIGEIIAYTYSHF